MIIDMNWLNNTTVTIGTFLICDMVHVAGARRMYFDIWILGFEKHAESLGKYRDSTSVLKVLPSKLDIK